jgi:hypothetical protein
MAPQDVSSDSTSLRNKIGILLFHKMGGLVVDPLIK